MPCAIVILAAIAAWAAYAGAFYQTGQDWYNACWTSQHARRAAETPQESITWSRCEPVTLRAFFGAGFIAPGEAARAVTQAERAVAQACPSSYSDVPIGGLSFLAVRLIEASGGPTFTDRFLPVDSMIARAFKERWPQCQATRIASGYPKVIQIGDKWDYETPCKPCETEMAARSGR